MGFLSDWLDFAKFNVSDQWRKIKEDPERPFIGAMDQAGSKVWGTLLGKDYEPMTDWFGGAPFQTYDRAEAKGINTKPFGTGQTIANTIASLYAGGYGAQQLGGLGAGVGGASEGGGGMLSSLGGGGGGTFGGELFQLGGSAGGESALGAGGMNGYLSSIGLDGGGSFAGQSAFQLPSSAYTPEYLNSLADYQGVDAGDRTLLDRLTGNTEQGLYKQEALAKQASGQTVSDMLKKKAQQSALSQLSKGGSAMQQQGQQSPQMQVPQAMMNRGQPVNTTAALLSLLQEQEMLRQPRISLI